MSFQKAAALLLAGVLLISLNACGRKEASAQPTAWIMSLVQSGEDGDVLYCSEKEKEIYPQAGVHKIVCRMDDSSVEIQDSETDETWRGAYKLVKDSDTESIYEATIGDRDCMLVKSVTEYEGSQDPKDTLILTCDEYSLTFFTEE